MLSSRRFLSIGRRAAGAVGLLALLTGFLLPAPRSVAAEEKAPAPAAEASEKKTELYRLRPGDEISVSVLPQKEYDCSGVILPDGRVYLRTVGALVVEGLTVPALEELIRKKLEEELVEPVVRVALVRLAPPPEARMTVEPPPGKITLVGAVGRTGILQLEPGLRLRKALDLAGGASRDADLTRVSIIHPDLTRTIVDISTPERVSDPRHNVLLKDGDSVEVPLLPPAPVQVANPVRIAGEVANPGQFELKQGMTLEDLIIAAGRLTVVADLSNVELRRETGPITINLLDQREQGLNGKILLQPGDEVYVPAAKDTVLLIGSVQNPGSRPLKPGITIRDFFLSPEQAAAVAPANQNLDATRVIRRGAKEPIRVDLDDVLKKPKRKDNVTLQPGDVIFIPPRDNRRNNLLDTMWRLLPTGFLFSLF